MKGLRAIPLLLCLLVCLCACTMGSAVTLQDRMTVPEDGILSARLLSQFKEENAIAVVEGCSNGLTYEWTIFGSDIDRPEDMDLRVELHAQPGRLQVRLVQETPFGFPALLSVRLAEKWSANAAGAWQEGRPVCSVSLTGTQNTIVNLPVGEVWGDFLILPEQTAETPTQTVAGSDSYLSPIDNDQTNLVQPVSPDRPTDQPPAVQPDGYLTQGQAGSGAVYGTTKLPDAPAAAPEQTAPTQPDGYLSDAAAGSDRVYSTTTGGRKDRYHTDPVPAGKPQPVEPQDQQVDTHKQYTCTFSIECTTILNNLSQLTPGKLEMLPSNGVILPRQAVTFYEGESVFDVLQRLCRENGIHLESSWTPLFNTAYIEGIHNLYEFDCGDLSGWMYQVNGWYPNYGCSRYQLEQGDVVEWRYTCDLGKDVGGGEGW